MCDKFDKVIKDVCKKIRVLDDVLGIVLFGSVAQKMSHSASDIDLYVFCNSEIDKEVFFYEDDVAVNVRYKSIENFKEGIMQQSRRLPDVLGNKVYYDPTNVIHEYLEKSRVLIDKGPIRLSEEEKTVLRVLLNSEPKIVKGMIEAGRTAESILLMNEILNSAISAYYDANSWWMPNNNTLICELKKRDNKIGRLAEDIVIDNRPEKKLEKLIDFCNQVSEIMGGTLIRYEIIR